jgi:alcohol dehydrogenase class IV
MKDTWSFISPTRLYYGEQWFSKLNEFTKELSSDGAIGLLTGRSSSRAHGFLDEILGHLKDREIHVFADIEPEPSHATVMSAKTFVEQRGIKALIAIGGGSVLDAAKAISCIAYTDLDITPLMDRLIPVPGKTIPLIALPTTAGTGSEVTPFSVLTNNETGAKKSLPSVHFYPDISIVVSRFITTVPQKVIGDVGMDALAHSFEALWSVHSNPISDAIAFRAIKLIRDNFLRYYCAPSDRGAADAMAQAATLAGKSFSNTFTAACHGLSYPIGQRFGMTHGASCAMTLHLIADLNKDVIKEKFEDLAKYLNLPNVSGVSQMIWDIRDQIKTIPTFRELRATVKDLEFIAKGAFKPLMDNNPIRLDERSIVNLLTREL